ncbi:uncharacterized protein [Mytilus edulis]|uniref:uncharacterized protein n=1 Tax=Mytilus edulis TaxID=6550 RepID=UPI0039F0582F
MRIRIISLCSVASLLFLTAWIDITESLFTNSVPKQRYIKRIIRIPVRSYRINTSRKTNIVSANIANIDSTIGPQRNIQFNPSVGRSLPKYRKVTFLSKNILQRLREAQRNANPKTGGSQVPIHHHTVVLAKNANILSNIGKQKNGPAINPAPAPTKGGNQPGLSQPKNPGQGVPNKPSQGSSNSVQNFVQGIKMGSGNTYQVNTDTGNTKVNSKIHNTNVSNNINNIHITNNYTRPSNAPSQGHSRQPYPQGQLPVSQSNLPYQPTGQRPNQGGHNPRPLPSGQQHPTGQKPTPGTKIYLNIVNNLPVKNNASNNNHRAKFSPSSVGMNPNFSTGFHGANNGHSNQASQNPGPLTLGAGSNTGAKPSMRQPGGNPASPGQGGALPSGRNRHGPRGQQGMGNQPGGSPLMSGMMPSGLGSLLFGGPPQSRNRGPSNQPGNTQYPFNGQLFRNAPSQINAAPGPQQPGGAHINQLGGKVPGSQPGAGHWQQPGGGQGQQPGGGQWQQPGGGHGQQPGGQQGQQHGGGHGQQPGGGHGQQPGGGHGQQPGGGHGQQPGGGHGQQPGGGHGQQPGGGQGQHPGGGQWQQPGGGQGQQPGGGQWQQPGGGQGQQPGGGQGQQPGGGQWQQPGGGQGQQPGGGQGQQPGGGQWQQPGGGHGQQPGGGHGQQPGGGHGQQPGGGQGQQPGGGQWQQPGGGHGQQPGGGHGQQPGGGQGQQPGGGQWQQPGGGHGQQPGGGHGQQPGGGHGQQPSYNPAYPISVQGQQAGGGQGQQPGGGHGQQPI